MKLSMPFFSLLFLMSGLPLFAQINVAVHFGTYGEIMNGEYVNGSYETIDLMGTIMYSEENHSYGAGREYGTSVAYRFKKKFLVGVDLLVLNGKVHTRTERSTSSQGWKEHEGHTLRFSAFLQNMIPVNKRQNLEIYSRLGIIYATKNEVETRERSTTSFFTVQEEERESLFTGGSGFGASAGLGLRYTDASGVFFQLGAKAVFQKFRPERRIYVKYITNGENILPTLDTYALITEYEESFIRSNSTVADRNKPKKELPISFPFSGLGVEFLMGYQF